MHRTPTRRAEVVPAPERRGADHAPRRWLSWVARLGYATSGLVYLAIGLAGLAVAVGISDRARGHHDVLVAATALPLGRVALASLAVGLACYAAMNLMGGVADTYGVGRGIRGWVMWGGDVLVGGLYLSLAATAVRLLAQPGRTAGPTAAAWAAQVMSAPAGRAMLAAVGIAVLLAGVFLVHKAVDAPFAGRLDRRRLGARAVRWLLLAARVGTAARGALLVVCGLAAIGAANHRAPTWVAELADGLDLLAEGRTGPLLVGLISAAFAAYGVYQFAKARYRVLRF
ncbi:MAG TPA: DUF1206 domain-containing protein [Gemmatimonadaceae bacterium]|nr:DUF1206 domain-containing protein [Gemmatimonadaceae bacterium]